MKGDATDPDDEASPEAVPSELKDRIAQAQHDLRNPLGNILGFCEILLKPIQALADQELMLGIASIDQSATQMVIEINQALDPDKIPVGAGELKALQGRLDQRACHILVTIKILLAKAAALNEDLLSQDLARMSDSARRVSRLIQTELSFYPPRSEC